MNGGEVTELWYDLESACALIKHSSETIDLYDLRSLFRRCQDALDEIRDELDDLKSRIVVLPAELIAAYERTTNG